jgi:hypothetical protein
MPSSVFIYIKLASQQTLIVVVGLGPSVPFSGIYKKEKKENGLIF